jgi:NAD(P)-dependent dehydrogenase (short-subunit alcohol dehydrogenase family)
MTEQLKGKICLITGASSGIGFETARALAGMDATVIMVSSRPDKLRKAMEEVIQQTKNNNVVAVPCDLSSQASIHRLADEILSDFSRLDILINNAGVFRSSKHLTEDGYEWTFAVNHLAPFLLTNLLLGRIIASSPSRIVNLVSSFHIMGRIKIEDLHFSGKWYDGLVAYNRSKLANVMFSYELDRKLAGTGVTVNASDPWGTRTNLLKEAKGFYRFLWDIQWPTLQPTHKGAQTSVYLASSEELKKTSGKYFRHKRQVRSSKSSHNNVASEKLWTECERLTGASYDEVINSWKANNKF